MRDWIAIFLLYVFVFGIVVYVFFEADEQISINEVFSRLAVAIPGLLLLRSGLISGVLLGNFLLSTAEQRSTRKAYWIKSAKREGLWYAGAVASLLLAYRWTPFAGHADIFFIFAVAIPLGAALILALYSYHAH